MQKLLKKGVNGLIAKIYYMEAQQEAERVLSDMQHILDKHDKAFQEIPKGVPQKQYHKHAIELIQCSTPPSIAS
jgi:hypothetical protein